MSKTEATLPQTILGFSVQGAELFFFGGEGGGVGMPQSSHH